MIKKSCYFSILYLTSFFLTGPTQAADIKFFNQGVTLSDKAIDFRQCNFPNLLKLQEDLKLDPIKTYISVSYDTNRAWGEANIMIPSPDARLLKPQINEIMYARGIEGQYTFNKANDKYWNLSINLNPYRLRLVGFTTPVGSDDPDQWISHGTVLLAIVDKNSNQECDLISNPHYQDQAIHMLFDQDKTQP